MGASWPQDLNRALLWQFKLLFSTLYFVCKLSTHGKFSLSSWTSVLYELSQTSRWVKVFCPDYHKSNTANSLKHIKSSLTVWNIPTFKDRANWSRDTFQPMRRRACVYQQTNQNIAPVIKNFQNSGRSRTELKMSLQYSSRFHI